MSEITAELINKLEQLSTNQSAPLEKRLIDTAVWYHKNKDYIPREALDKRLEFLEKTFDIFLEMMAMSVQRQQTLEGFNKSKHLFVPRGMVDTDTGKEYG